MNEKFVFRLTNSQRIAMLGILIAYRRMGDQPQAFRDVIANVTTLTDDLLLLFSKMEIEHAESDAGRKA